MNKYIIVLALLISSLLTQHAQAIDLDSAVSGYILLQVEANGEAWYVFPTNGKAYYLGRPADAFEIMKKLALGAKHDFIINTTVFDDSLAGMILLDVERHGEAYYIYPKDHKKYYLGRPEDAFKIMRQLGLGATNFDIANIPIGIIGEPVAVIRNYRKVLIENVPFTSQAPYGDWDDSRQQNGCEEASVLMAIRWARGETLSKDQALSSITGISDWLTKKYGESRDTSAEDTINWIIKDYFKYDKVKLVRQMTVTDIIKELNNGHLIITPMNGQIMNNPNFRAPGPPRHMIVIRGYDPEKQEFITNDPGTRNGELYRYDAKLLYNAIRDYPTGYHEIINEIEKDMIVIWK
jgi:hypothetical protein